jgi:hypothetical protein
MSSTEQQSPRFIVPLPGGRVARVPAEVLEQYVDTTARSCHSPEQDAAQAETTSSGDVTGHHTDAATGEWHTDWELGPCSYTDDSGFPQYGHHWHRHPMGSEYAEVRL